MDIFQSDNVKLLVQALLRCDTEDECAGFLRDLMTTRELLDISQRLAVASQLDQGVTCAEVKSQCGTSSATVSRVNQCYLYGAGGYRSILKKLNKGGA